MHSGIWITNHKLQLLRTTFKFLNNKNRIKVLFHKMKAVVSFFSLNQFKKNRFLIKHFPGFILCNLRCILSCRRTSWQKDWKTWSFRSWLWWICRTCSWISQWIFWLCWVWWTWRIPIRSWIRSWICCTSNRNWSCWIRCTSNWIGTWSLWL